MKNTLYQFIKWFNKIQLLIALMMLLLLWFPHEIILMKIRELDAKYTYFSWLVIAWVAVYPISIRLEFHLKPPTTPKPPSPLQEKWDNYWQQTHICPNCQNHFADTDLIEDDIGTFTRPKMAYYCPHCQQKLELVWDKRKITIWTMMFLMLVCAIVMWDIPSWLIIPIGVFYLIYLSRQYQFNQSD